jgi:hypothetical protein
MFQRESACRPCSWDLSFVEGGARHRQNLAHILARAAQVDPTLGQSKKETELLMQVNIRGHFFFSGKSNLFDPDLLY